MSNESCIYWTTNLLIKKFHTIGVIQDALLRAKLRLNNIIRMLGLLHIVN